MSDRLDLYKRLFEPVEKPYHWIVPLSALPFGLGSDVFTVFGIMKLWGWFAVPALAAPALSFWQIAGLWLLVAMIWRHRPDSRIVDTRTPNEKTNAAWTNVVASYLTTALFLLLGWAIL